MITFNNTKTIYDLIKNVGKEYENRVFFRYEIDEEIFEKGYGTFTADTLALGHYILEKTQKDGHQLHAAILGKCCYEYLVALMGVPCGGGVAMPMDVQLSAEKLAENLKKADTDILFFTRDFASQAHLAQQMCPSIKRLICLHSIKNGRSLPNIVKIHRGETYKSPARPEDCAMIIFTSGTTGQGKGVMLSHGNIIDNMFCTDDDTEVCLNVLPIHHIFCISGDVMLVLRYGSTLCLCDDLTKMLYYIQRFQPSMIRVVPAMAKMLVNRIAALQQKYPEKSNSEVREMVLGKRLTRMTSGGGYLSEALSSALLKLGIITGQGYGMSECAPKISVPDYEWKEKVTSVGHPVTGCKIRIVDGEIQVQSPSVMMGYYNDPELTKEALTEDGWLCTGDLGYLDEDGFLYLSGRKKNLIILSNGENVSPEMIENHFDGDRLVAEIVAYGQDDVIAAEVYPNFEYAQTNGITDIRAAINEIVANRNKELPTYAQIATVTVRTTPFEKTSSKKIIRKAFFDKKAEQAAQAKNHKLPETAFQQKIYDLIARTLGHSDFGIDDNLYHCGMDSMCSMMLISDIEEELGENITLGELMEHPSVIEIEEFFLAKAGEEKIDLSPREVYPLTGMQKYFAYIIPGNTTGNLPFSFRMSKEVDLLRLRDAIHAVLDAHPSLKAIVKPTEQKYYAIFRDDSRVIDIPIQPIKDAEAEEMMQKLIVPFRFRADDDLVHIYLFEGEEHNYMFFDVAHFMGDGMTMNIIMEDLKKAYDGEEFEKETYTTFEYILEEQMRETNGIRAKNSAYVTELMKPVRMDRSILNKAEEEDLSKGRFGVIKKRLGSVARKNVLYYGKQHGVSENAMFLTAFNYTISLFSDQDEVFCSSIHSGRTDSRWSRLAGSLFETYYYRYSRVDHEKVEDLLRKGADQIMNTMKCLVSCPKESEMFFQFQGDILEVEQVGGASTERIHVQLNSLPFHLQVMYDEKGYYVELRFWENRFDYDMLNIFLTCFEEILRAMMTETSVRLLKNHLPDEVYPSKFHIETGKLEEAAGKKLFKYTDGEEKIRIYIFDESYNKKPYGAWGPLYIFNYEPMEFTDHVQFPYGPGTIYNTGLIARIMPDGSVDFLDKVGRKVLTDGLRGVNYFDLKKAEETLMSIPEVAKAECFLSFDQEANEMMLAADIRTAGGAKAGEGSLAEDAIRGYMKENAGDLLVPKFINFV
ncbi:MAG: AMP-binding protein [Eubacteriales bacterium]|nr:AMP-binding protein [Eubacteriales bacterium]